MELSEAFFAPVRKTLYSGNLPQSAVTAFNAMYTEGMARKLSLAQIAYVMATPYREVGSHLIPIEEDFELRNRSSYGTRTGWNSDGTQNTRQPYAGLYYYGRGWPQLTFCDNYIRMGKRLGLPLAEQPQLLLQLHVSCLVSFEGMQYALFTKYRLSDFINGDKRDYVGARKIVNGEDHAALVASYAECIYTGLLADAEYQKSNLVATKTPQTPVIAGKTEPTGIKGWFGKWFG